MSTTQESIADFSDRVIAFYRSVPDLISGIDGRLARARAYRAALDDAGFRAMFAGSPIKRIGRDRFVRNVLYAIGNSGEKRLEPAAQSLTDDPDPTVAEAARWAVERLR